MYAWLPEALATDAVVLTANRRLARQLHVAHGEHELAAGRLAWQTPSIHAFDDWCRMLVDTSAAPAGLPVALDAFSSGIVWEQCLLDQGQYDLLAQGGVVRQARDAWARLCAWNVPLDAAADAARSADERLFAAAARAYEARLRTAGWVDRDGLPPLVAGLLGEGWFQVPARVMLAGFDRVVPAVRAVMDALEARGSVVGPVPEPPLAPTLQVASCPDADAEMRSAGAWARDILQRQPEATLAIVNPDLQASADRSARLVREALAPGWQYADAAWRDSVNVSYGRKLSEYPAIATALLLLRWIHQGLPMTELSLVLRSRSIGGQEGAGRSRLELFLRQLPDRSWTPGGLLRAVEGRDVSADTLQWVRGVEASITLQNELSEDASPAVWASRIDGFLAEWHWPGSPTLTSDEFQLINRWRDLLNELASTALVMPRMSFREALHRVAARAAEIVFQPESGSGMVTLLGTLEAAGLQFEHIWVSGVHAGEWPGTGHPSPLLSRQLQRTYAMPDATPADTLAFSRRVLRRLASSAANAVFSWPQNDDESELAISSLLDEFPGVGYAGPNDPGWHALSFFGQRALEIKGNDAVPAVAEDEEVRGGAYTVQRQAIEPFAAFVYGRLGVKEPQSIEVGVSASLRGNIIHETLCEFFATCPSQDQIRQWSETEIAERLGSAIDTVIAPHLRHADPTLSRLLGLERTRLYHLVQDFVRTELARADFAIAGVEKAIDYEMHGVRLDLRIDRIDRLPDGTLLVIDYKTGAPKNLLNREGNPLDLQLVVYADALDEAIGGLVLINLDRREISYKGTGGSVEWDAARKDEWPERLAAWRADVHRTLAEFAAGDVRVNLRQSTADARPLGILSRVEELKRAL